MEMGKPHGKMTHKFVKDGSFYVKEYNQGKELE